MQCLNTYVNIVVVKGGSLTKILGIVSSDILFQCASQPFTHETTKGVKMVGINRKLNV